MSGVHIGTHRWLRAPIAGGEGYSCLMYCAAPMCCARRCRLLFLKLLMISCSSDHCITRLPPALYPVGLPAAVDSEMHISPIASC